ncbi:SH3 domain protein [Cooperia oncophora]
MAETRLDSQMAEPSLSFSKNDMITITQQIEGGWWEGTINGKTGWFPANYASIITEKDKLMRSKSVPNASALANGINASNGISGEN